VRDDVPIITDPISRAVREVLARENRIRSIGVRLAGIFGLIGFVVTGALYAEWSVRVHSELLGAVVVTYAALGGGLTFAALYLGTSQYLRSTRAKRAARAAAAAEVPVEHVAELLF
jgi:hypothetical protein